MIRNLVQSLSKNAAGLPVEISSIEQTDAIEKVESVGEGDTMLKTGSNLEIASVPPGIMAYMGDGIYEIIVRNFFVQRKLWDSHKIHRRVIQFVNAGAQAALLRYLEDKLTDEERTILRRARNAHTGNVPRNAKVVDYRYSTAFEAVLGYTMLRGDFQRLQELVQLIENYLLEQISGK